MSYFSTPLDTLGREGRTFWQERDSVPLGPFAEVVWATAFRPVHSDKAGRLLSDLRPAPTSCGYGPEPDGAPCFSCRGFQEPSASPAPCAAREIPANAEIGSGRRSSLSASRPGAPTCRRTDLSKSLVPDEDFFSRAGASGSCRRRHCRPLCGDKLRFPRMVQVEHTATGPAACPSGSLSYGSFNSSSFRFPPQERRIQEAEALFCASRLLKRGLRWGLALLTQLHTQ